MKRIFFKFSVFLTLLLFSIYCSAGEGVYWLTDGSPMDFSDTIVLEGVDTPGVSFLKDEYEGAFEYEIPVGSDEIILDEQMYPSAEAEWVLIKEDGFSEDVDEYTEVTLQGMIEGKYFGPFKKDPKRWLPSSLGNNLIALGPGIETTLFDIIDGNHDAQVQVKYFDSKGRLQVFYSHSDDLKGLPIIELIQSVVKNSDEVVTHINLGANGKHSAFVNQSKIRFKSIFKAIFTGGLKIAKLKRKILYHISKDIIKKKKYADSPMELTVYDGDEVVGGGILNIRLQE